MLNILKQKEDHTDSNKTCNAEYVQARIDELRSAVYTLDSSFAGRLRALRFMWSLSAYLPRTTTNTAEWQQSVKFNSNFSEITFENTIKGALLFITDPKSEKTILELCDIKITSKDIAVISFAEKGEAKHLLDDTHYRLPMAICLGSDSFLHVAAGNMGLPKFVSRLAVAGFLRKRPVIMKSCLTQKVKVPFDADVVIEGYVQKSDGNFHITCTSHRKEIILPLNWFRP